MKVSFMGAISVIVLLSITIAFISFGPKKAEAQTPFKDIKGSNHYHAIVALYDAKVITGRTATEYKPNLTVTRGETAQFIVNALGINNNTSKNPGYSDVPTTNPYYNAIAILTEKGVVSGYGNGKYGPNDSLTRSQVATMLTKAFELNVSTVSKTQFTDINNLKDPIILSYVQTLVDYGITVGTTKTTFSPSMKLTRGHLATFLYRAIENNSLEVISVE
ncbi:S-layer homology domain-containing protein [Lysinibacillus sp. SGAir0095]|uniref:S-layer homology domain-containing protein n=1 Tax=Lysinibacillus sp. SGAir0095 TaxID=2070463 RepID=UPI001F107631|nr:S-layer homology domain-containing protein [Lysinibacillus sp. SGAir0095]